MINLLDDKKLSVVSIRIRGQVLKVGDFYIALPKRRGNHVTVAIFSEKEAAIGRLNGDWKEEEESGEWKVKTAWKGEA